MSLSNLERTITPSENQQKKTEYRRDPLHGFMYQIKILMLFVHRGLREEHEFSLGTEIKWAEKFDDLVYKYIKDKSTTYRFLQAKHSKKRGKKITEQHLLTESDGDYSLVKYFFSYRKIKEAKQLKGKIEDVIIFTNIDFDEILRPHQTTDQEKKKEIIKITAKPITHDDAILKFDINKLPRLPSRYRFGQDQVGLEFLRENAVSSLLTKLAEKLLKCLLDNEVMLHFQEPFKAFHMILAKEVFNISDKMFESNFLEGQSSLYDKKGQPVNDTGRFRKVFKEAFERETDKIEFVKLNEAIKEGQVLRSKKIGLNFSRNFGKKNAEEVEVSKEIDWPKNNISEEEVKDFCDHLVFAVNQPNEEELDHIIKQELGESFGEDWANNFFCKLQTKMLRFFREKENYFLSSLEWKKFFDAEKEKVAVYFCVKDPTSLFTGRTDQLDKLHEMLQESNRKPHTTSICGLGGVGKSEMVRRYINLHKSDFDNRVIWLNAESYAKLSESFEKLASEKLEISLNKSDGSPKHIRSIVEHVYTHFSKAKSLFVFDNSDDNIGLESFLPGSLLRHKPYVIITSRNRDWGPIPVLYLDVLTNSEAMELIKKALNINSDAQNNEICTLAETLQFFPLALQQALAYIKVTDAKLKIFGKKFGIEDYLNRLENDPKQLLDFRFPRASDISYPETTFTTWNKTIEKIRSYPEIGEKAIDILVMMAFLEPDDIPASMFLPICDNEETIGSTLLLLEQFSIVSSGQDPKHLNIHKLVQLVARLNLSRWKNVVQDQDDEESSLLKVCSLSLSYVSEIANENQHSLRHKFVAHLVKLLSNLDESETRDKTVELNSIVPLLSAMGEEYNAIGRYHIKQEQHITKNKEFDSENVQAADTFCTLPVTLGGEGELIKAKELLARYQKLKNSFTGPAMSDNFMEVFSIQ